MRPDFDAATHTYTTPDGLRLPSVTQVLQDCGIVDYSYLGERGDYYLLRGRAIHAATQMDDEGTLDEATVDPQIRPYLDAWRRYKSEHRDLAWMLTEHRLAHPLFGFAGTPDRAGNAISNAGPIDTVLDIKTTVVAPWVRYQLAAYAAMIDQQKPGRIRRIGLALHKDGTYQVTEFPYCDFREDFGGFMAALTVYRIKRPKGEMRSKAA